MIESGRITLMLKKRDFRLNAHDSERLHSLGYEMYLESKAKDQQLEATETCHLQALMRKVSK